MFEAIALLNSPSTGPTAPLYWIYSTTLLDDALLGWKYFFLWLPCGGLPDGFGS